MYQEHHFGYAMLDDLDAQIVMLLYKVCAINIVSMIYNQLKFQFKRVEK